MNNGGRPFYRGGVYPDGGVWCAKLVFSQDGFYTDDEGAYYRSANHGSFEPI